MKRIVAMKGKIFLFAVIALVGCMVFLSKSRRDMTPEMETVPTDEVAMAGIDERTLAFEKAPLHPDARDFHIPLSRAEKDNIRYIIITLATKSQISLLFHKSALHRAGNNVSHVHPLKFLAFIFTDNELKKATRRISGLPWKRFVQGMAESLENESRRSNVNEEHVAVFAEEVGVNRSYLEPSVQSHRWGDFINTVRNQVR